MSTERVNFGSKLGIILATAGSAVGLGNVWCFPYMTGENGGAAFIFIYLLCVLFLGIPCMLAEFIIGRRGAANTARSYSRLANGTPWKYIGLLGVLTGFLITSYYAVVSGWCLQYIFATLVGELKGDSAYVNQYFQEFSTSTFRPVLWTVIILLLTHYVVQHGVRRGIERASKLLMPTLFILLLVIVVAACMLPNADAGLRFLFQPDFTHLNRNVFLGALGQSFYSLSIAMGCICTYASYFTRETNLLRSAVQVSVVDTLVAILAGMMIFPIAFSVGVNPDSGPSLIFITLPNVFNTAFSGMPVMGFLVSLAFYALLSLAALTSLISLHEVSTAFLHEELHTTRQRGALVVTVCTVVLGIFCSLSLGAMGGLQWAGKTLFDWFDFVTGQIFLPLGGFLTCIFLGWYVNREVVFDEFTNQGMHSLKFFRLFLFLIRYVCPVCILIIFLHQFGLI